eukprot:SAG11_NODE_33065_length_279_cov_0.850000_1_plen_23_part_10
MAVVHVTTGFVGALMAILAPTAR